MPRRCSNPQSQQASGNRPTPHRVATGIGLCVYVCVRVYICMYVRMYVYIVMRRLTGIRSEKCVVGRFRRCANVIECTYTNLDSTV
jgi:hypothetical protein